MKIRIPSLALLAALLVGALPAAQPKQLSPAEKADGWKLLFDGTSLSGWRGYKTEAPAGWTIKAGVLSLAAGRKGDLVTMQEYGDFELALDWEIAAGGNSGILYRVGLGDAARIRFTETAMTPVVHLHWWLNLAPFQADPMGSAPREKAFLVKKLLCQPEAIRPMRKPTMTYEKISDWACSEMSVTAG